MIAEFAARNKSQYIEDIETGNGKAWTVVMGNEAGDLDSMASALAYAWMEVEIHRRSLVVPLVQTPRPDLNLRAENSHALSIAGFEPQKRELLCVDDLSKFASFPSNKFALVDHNRLGSHFLSEHPDAAVVAIVDHHDDEGLYKGTADPRMIVPTGSCASLVTGLIEKHCPEDVQIPPGLATLLISSILIDTNGLKPGGKAGKIDVKAVNYLLPRSTLVSSVPPAALINRPGASPSTPPKLNPEKVHEIPALIELTSTLHTKKVSVSHLGTRDLIRRDYKEYSLAPTWNSYCPITIGLASVPVGLKSWTLDAKFADSTQKWIAERNLAALGILTSFREEPWFGEKGRGKHQREFLMVVGTNVGNGKLEKLLWEELERSEELKLTSFKGSKVQDGFGPAVKARVYKQGNVDATRKVIAPLLKTIIEGSS